MDPTSITKAWRAEIDRIPAYPIGKFDGDGAIIVLPEKSYLEVCRNNHIKEYFKRTCPSLFMNMDIGRCALFVPLKHLYNNM